MREGRRSLSGSLLRFCCGAQRNADPKNIEYPPQPDLPLLRYDQPLYLLKPEARLARALVELDPRHVPAPPINFWHGALHRSDAPELEAGNGATHSLPNLAVCVSHFTHAGDLFRRYRFSRSGPPLTSRRLELLLKCQMIAAGCGEIPTPRAAYVAGVVPFNFSMSISPINEVPFVCCGILCFEWQTCGKNCGVFL